MQPIPQNIQEALNVLDQMEAMVQAMFRHEARTAAHAQWLDRMRTVWGSPQGRAEASALIVDGPLEQRADGAASDGQNRQRTLACALLEAAIYELMEPPVEGGEGGGGEASADDQARDLGLPDTVHIQQVLRDWLKLGAWRANEKSPLTEIGRMIERSSESAEDSVATRLGLLVPFWSSLTLWRLLSSPDAALAMQR